MHHDRDNLEGPSWAVLDLMSREEGPSPGLCNYEILKKKLLGPKETARDNSLIFPVLFSLA